MRRHHVAFACTRPCRVQVTEFLEDSFNTQTKPLAAWVCAPHTATGLQKLPGVSTSFYQLPEPFTRSQNFIQATHVTSRRQQDAMMDSDCSHGLSRLETAIYGETPSTPSSPSRPKTASEPGGRRSRDRSPAAFNEVVYRGELVSVQVPQYSQYCLESVTCSGDGNVNAHIGLCLPDRRRDKLWEGSSVRLASRERMGSSLERRKIVDNVQQQAPMMRYHSDPNFLETGCEDACFVGPEDKAATAVRTVELRRQNGSFGFVLLGAVSHCEGGNSSPLTPSGGVPALQSIDSVTPGGAAERAGVRAKDFVLEVNGTDVINAPHERVVQLMKLSNQRLRLTLLTPTARDVTAPRHRSRCDVTAAQSHRQRSDVTAAKSLRRGIIASDAEVTSSSARPQQRAAAVGAISRVKAGGKVSAYIVPRRVGGAGTPGNQRVDVGDTQQEILDAAIPSQFGEVVITARRQTSPTRKNVSTKSSGSMTSRLTQLGYSWVKSPENRKTLHRSMQDLSQASYPCKIGPHHNRNLSNGSFAAQKYQPAFSTLAVANKNLYSCEFDADHGLDFLHDFVLPGENNPKSGSVFSSTIVSSSGEEQLQKKHHQNQRVVTNVCLGAKGQHDKVTYTQSNQRQCATNIARPIPQRMNFTNIISRQWSSLENLFDGKKRTSLSAFIHKQTDLRKPIIVPDSPITRPAIKKIAQKMEGRMKRQIRQAENYHNNQKESENRNRKVSETDNRMDDRECRINTKTDSRTDDREHRMNNKTDHVEHKIEKRTQDIENRMDNRTRNIAGDRKKSATDYISKDRLNHVPGKRTNEKYKDISNNQPNDLSELRVSDDPNMGRNGEVASYGRKDGSGKMKQKPRKLHNQNDRESQLSIADIVPVKDERLRQNDATSIALSTTDNDLESKVPKPDAALPDLNKTRPSDQVDNPSIVPNNLSKHNKNVPESRTIATKTLMPVVRESSNGINFIAMAKRARQLYLEKKEKLVGGTKDLKSAHRLSNGIIKSNEAAANQYSDRMHHTIRENYFTNNVKYDNADSNHLCEPRLKQRPKSTTPSVKQTTIYKSSENTVDHCCNLHNQPNYVPFSRTNGTKHTNSYPEREEINGINYSRNPRKLFNTNDSLASTSLSLATATDSDLSVTSTNSIDAPRRNDALTSISYKEGRVTGNAPILLNDFSPPPPAGFGNESEGDLDIIPPPPEFILSI